MQNNKTASTEVVRDSILLVVGPRRPPRKPPAKPSPLLLQPNLLGTNLLNLLAQPNPEINR